MNPENKAVLSTGVVLAVATLLTYSLFGLWPFIMFLLGTHVVSKIFG